MIYVIFTLFFILFLIAVFIFFNVTKLRDINNSLSLCNSKLDEMLNRKLSVINSILNKLDDKKLKNDFIYKDTFNIYEKEKSLFDASFAINKYVKDNKCENVLDEIRELNIIEENIDGLKDFYNAHVLNYNEVFLKKYLNKLYRLFKFNDYKAFKIRKLEEYEIFKI